MEKLQFTIRFIVLMVAFPVIMFTELTRTDKGTTEQKEQTTDKVSVKTTSAAMFSYTSAFMQAVSI